ncbi:phosphatase PAP2 family protein [Xylophilus sp.]|uniref:phosphatase PAP2 family protein n=1 Tax=Xylophilus sp. TaxID=2653893 RepID=UPI0013B9F805|nr:phosphatase PAP2 family protein [Xylophilus sp.]KAF1048230.1 MAG: putative undecaprenyl-diphosphatase YbjG [Xylophilus sp.]
MRGFETALFTLLNATPDSPSWVVPLAAWISNVLPHGAAVALGAWLLATPSRAQRVAILQALAGAGMAWLMVRGIRAVVHLPRPAELELGWQWLAHRGGPALPSMHATGAFALATGLGLSRALPRRALWVAFAVATAMAWSRVCLGLHCPTDVAAGALCGAAGAALASTATAWRPARGTAVRRWRAQPGR